LAVNYIIFDLEATCWLGRPPKGYNEIIEIGAVKINEYGEQTGTFERFIKPTVNPKLSGFCKKLTSISQQQVNTARTFPHVYDEFMEWAEVHETDYYLCSWGKNDIKLLLSNCELHKLDEHLLDQYTNLKPQYNRIKGSAVGGTLKKIVIKEGYEFTGKAHRAISDAENLAKIFLKYFDEWIFL
jgi:inhibitor of KinA sporulation pathway (predicted exonuclease)